MSIQSLEIRTLVSMKNMKQKKMVIQPLYLFSQPVRELVYIYLKIKKSTGNASTICAGKRLYTDTRLKSW